MKWKKNMAAGPWGPCRYRRYTTVCRDGGTVRLVQIHSAVEFAVHVYIYHKLVIIRPQERISKDRHTAL